MEKHRYIWSNTQIDNSTVFNIQPKSVQQFLDPNVFRVNLTVNQTLREFLVSQIEQVTSADGWRRFLAKHWFYWTAWFVFIPEPSRPQPRRKNMALKVQSWSLCDYAEEETRVYMPSQSFHPHVMKQMSKNLNVDQNVSTRCDRTSSHRDSWL